MKHKFSQILSTHVEIFAGSILAVIAIIMMGFSLSGCSPKSEAMPAESDTSSVDSTSSEASRPARDDYAAWLAAQPGVIVYKDVELYQYTLSESLVTFALKVEGKPETVVIPSKFVYSLLYSFGDAWDYHGDVYYASEPVKVPEEYRWQSRTDSKLYGYCFVRVA